MNWQPIFSFNGNVWVLITTTLATVYLLYTRILKFRSRLPLDWGRGNKKNRKQKEIKMWLSLCMFLEENAYFPFMTFPSMWRELH